MRISDWSSDVCSSDLLVLGHQVAPGFVDADVGRDRGCDSLIVARDHDHAPDSERFEPRYGFPCRCAGRVHEADRAEVAVAAAHGHRSEEHTSELQSLMRISYAVFCLNKKNKHKYDNSMLYI